MKKTTLLNALTTFSLLAPLGFGADGDADSAAKSIAPPGKYDVCWVGNTFSGNGGPNGFGYWVQNGADEIEVAPNGVVLAGCGWDEAGRCAGLHRDGKVNRVLLKQEDVPETAWGWNTGNNALAFDGDEIYIANTGKRLIRFVGSADDLDSWKPADEVKLPDEPVGANAKKGVLAVAYASSLELRRTKDFQTFATWTLPGAASKTPQNSQTAQNNDGDKKAEKSGPAIRDVVLDGRGGAWVLVDAQIRLLRLGADGKTLTETKIGAFPTLGAPTSLAFDAKNPALLIVCDDGPDQQVKFFDVSKPNAPKLTKTFGEKGGLFSQTTDAKGRRLVDGETFPTRLYSPRGAGTDAQGNLYVSLGFNGAPVGTLVLRSFAPDGSLRWELANCAFVDTFGFDATADGARIYTRTAILELDPDSKNADLDWRQVATTVDALRYSKEEDERPFYGASAFVKTLEGRRLFYTIGQYGGGFHFYSFDEENGGQIARPVGKIRSDDETWAWRMDENGDVWHGDHHQTRSIRRYRFQGWRKVESADVPNLYAPIYDVENPVVWPWPDDFELVRRIFYVPETDTLYLSGYLKTDEIDSWGVCGKTLRRYDGWTSGSPKIAWTVPLPVNPTGENGKPLSPEGLDVAGDYIFCGMVKADEGRQRTYALETATGKVLGAFVPGGAVGEEAGWQDMPYSVAALKRKNGDYWILVEEDWRGKNILYRWTPPTSASSSNADAK